MYVVIENEDKFASGLGKVRLGPTGEDRQIEAISLGVCTRDRNKVRLKFLEKPQDKKMIPVDLELRRSEALSLAHAILAATLADRTDEENHELATVKFLKEDETEIHFD